MSEYLRVAEEQLVEFISEFGSTITIISPGGESIELPATIAQQETEQDAPTTAGRNGTIAEEMDFVFARADYPDEITRGHLIEFDGRAYRPASQPNRAHAEEFGRFGLLRRVHGVLIQRGDAS